MTYEWGCSTSNRDGDLINDCNDILEADITPYEEKEEDVVVLDKTMSLGEPTSEVEDMVEEEAA